MKLTRPRPPTSRGLMTSREAARACALGQCSLTGEWSLYLDISVCPCLVVTTNPPIRPPSPPLSLWFYIHLCVCAPSLSLSFSLSLYPTQILSLSLSFYLSIYLSIYFPIYFCLSLPFLCPFLSYMRFCASTNCTRYFICAPKSTYVDRDRRTDRQTTRYSVKRYIIINIFLLYVYVCPSVCLCMCESVQSTSNASTDNRKSSFYHPVESPRDISIK